MAVTFTIKDRLMKTQMRSFSRAVAALIVGLFILTGSSAFAQTALTTTTLGAAITDPAAINVIVASATGITAPGTGANLVFLLVDREIMPVRSVTGTTIGVNRTGRATTHINGAPVTIVPPLAIVANIPTGQCTRTNLLYVPMVANGGAVPSDGTGWTFDCLGVTTAGQWVQTNGNGFPTLGSTVASPAGVMTATGVYFKVSGTNAVTGITAPAGVQPGFTLQIEPTGIFTWTTATNITVAGTAVVGKVLYMVWNGAKWAPSYIA